MREGRGGAEDGAGGFASGGDRTDGDIKGTRDGDVTDADGLDGGVRRQQRSRGDIGDLGGGGALEGGRGGGRSISHRHQAVGSGRDERRGSGGELVDDPRGDHAVGGGDGRAVQVRDDELGVGTEVGRQAHQGHRTGVLADQVGGGNDGVVGRDGTLLDRDEVAALDIDGGKRLGNERGGRGRPRHAQITAAQVEHGRVGEAEIAARDGEAVASEHEALRLTGGDREAGVEDVDDRVRELSRGAGIITADLEETGDIKEAGRRQDVLERAVGDQQLAIPVDRGAAVVVLEVVEEDDAVGGDAGPTEGTTERITDDDARRAGEHVQRGQGQLGIARAEAVDASVGAEGGRGISLGALGAQEPRGVTGRVAADLGHVDRRVPTGHQLQRAAVGTGHRRAEGRADGETVRHEEAPDATHIRGGDARRRELGVVGDSVQRRQDREAAGRGGIGGPAEIRGLAGTVDDRSRAVARAGSRSGPRLVHVRAARVIVARAVELGAAVG